MHIFHRFLLLGLASVISISPALAAKKSASSKQRKETDTEAATQLQVFLDRANFSPGKLDGHYGDFTRKALALYRQSLGGQPQPAPTVESKSDTPPDVSGIDLASAGPAFITYTVTDADLQNIGAVPDSVAEKAKLKALPYRDAGEAICEKFHCDRKFLVQLNPGKISAMKPGDQLKVPNVEPFEFAAVKDLKPGSEVGANEIDDEPQASPPEDAGGKDIAAAEASPAIVVKVDTKTDFLTVREGDKLVAAYPVSIGSAQSESPLGEWKVRGVAKLPTFRYDEQMLNHGTRSNDFKMLPPGPNNPAGVIWIALNKKGIGLHGTNEPDEIGRSTSHGCVRLANWDIVRLAMRVKAGVPVSIF